MIATNMAGRGTDIKLRNFTREQLIEHWKRRNICPKEARVEMPDDDESDILAASEQIGQRPRDRAEIAMVRRRAAGEAAIVCGAMITSKSPFDSGKAPRKCRGHPI
jgi:preprotein translocase subunit SecA